MKNLALLTALAATLATGAVLVPHAADAANARHPYKHVNRANDRGNRTGDAETDRLNQQQLDQDRSAGGSAASAPGPAGAARASQGTSTK